MSNRHNLLLLNDSLYAWGKNDHGQLGTGDKENRNFPKNINDNFSISTEIISYKTGRNHSLALDSGNRVWSWGANDMGQLGIGDTTDRTFPIEIAGYFPDGTTIEQISAGFSHSIALDSEGEIWTWGSGSYGELGTGDTRGKTKPHNISSNLPPGTRVVKIQAGNRCTFLIDSDGKVWSFGNNEHGQLGTGDTEIRNIPTDISSSFPENTKIIDIKNGSNYSTLAIDSDNKVWAWGQNEMGELGTGNDDKYITPLNISNNFPTGTKIIDISIGFSHSLALDSQNELWVWGDNLFGQLGIGRIVRESTLPKNISDKFPTDTKISSIYAGKYHNICEDTDGNVWSWGSNRYGQLGISSFINSYTPKNILDEMYNSNGTQRMTSILSNILSNFFVYNSQQLETPEQLEKPEEDQNDDEDIRIYKKYLAEEYISRRRADPSCLIGDRTSYKRKWIINNCKQCKSLITLDEFVDEDYEDLISIKILDKIDNENTYKMSKGNCLSKTELTQMLESERNSISYQYIYCIWKNTSNTYDISGSKSEPTNILLFKLVLHDRTIFITFNSLVRILKSQSKVFYAIPMYNNKNRRIGNLEDSVSESRLHGQIPGYKVYMLVNREDFSSLSKSKTKRKYEFNIEKSGELNKYPTYLKIKHTDLLTLNRECNNRYFTTIVINELLDFILTDKDERDFTFPEYVEIETDRLLQIFPYCQSDYLLELTMESIRRHHTEKKED